MFSSGPSPLNNIGGDPRNILVLACHGSNVGSVPVVSKFDAAVAALESVDLHPRQRAECVGKLAGIFQNFVESGNWKDLDSLSLSSGLEAPGLEARLEVGFAVSELLTLARVSVREESLREQIAFATLRDLFGVPLTPGVSAVSEMEAYLKNAPEFIDRIIEFERGRACLPENARLTPAELRFVYRADELAVANLKLLIAHEMPASAAMKVTESLLLIKKQSLRDEVIDMWKWFAHSGLCSSMFDENRIPEPIGRAALVGALKGRDSQVRRAEPQGPLVVHQLPVVLPSNPADWKYLAQRLSYLSAIKDEDVRDLRIGAYIVSFREFNASRSFYEEEERHFRRMNLDGVSASDARRFYSDKYGVDNGPGPEGTDLAEKPLRETERAFRIMASARFGLNIRKAYTRTLHESGKWLMEHMAEELKGDSARYRYKDIEAYPGSGMRMWGLDIRNALDLSTPESRQRYLKAAPWIAASIRAGQDVAYHLTRGFMAIARTQAAVGHPLSRIWREKGSYEGEPYAALIFNDHFHNDRLPEVRMWLVPERVLNRKLVWAIENDVDINKLDLTPEGLAEEAEFINLPIFDIGCSCVRWGSFANAWPHGTGPAHEWERLNDWAYSRWQSPRHIHRAMSGENYTDGLSREVGTVMTAARVEHDKIKHMVDFFLDLHSSFLTMEEAWAKGYANAIEEPAREEPPEGPGYTQFGGGQEEGNSSNSDEAPLDMRARRPRTRMLEHFLELRNQIVTTKRGVSRKDIPSLQLQYTRLFARQDQTPYISGPDMNLVFPDGKLISLLGGKPRPGDVVTKVVEMNERMEAIWDQYIVSRFAPNNCPRIILP